MLVVLANDLPPAVRGRMKLWFIEPRPNVFISSVKDSVGQKIVEYLYKHCTSQSGIMIFRKTSCTPGYEIHDLGNTRKQLTEISGFQLIIDKYV